MTCKAVFGLFLMGVPDPRFPTNPAVTVLYTNGALPTAGRPTELVGATILPLVTGLPGVNWGANPRQPTGDAGSCTVTLCDDFVGGVPHLAKGALGKLFLVDRAAPEWGVESNLITDTTNTITLVNGASPDDDVPYFLGNECVRLVLTAGPTSGWTRSFDLTRALCGSTARVHTFKPSDMSEGGDGSQDRLFLKSKPDWSEGFLCGVYEFILDELGAIKDYMLRRGVVTGEPTPIAGHQYQVNIKFIEDRINAHKIGELSKETTLSRLILVHKLDTSEAGIDSTRPTEVSVLLQLHEAEAFFNEALSPRGGTKINLSYLSDLSERLFGDSDITYQVKVKNDAEWVYDLTSIGYYTWVSDGQFYEAVKLSCVLTEGGFVPGTGCIVAAEGTNDYNLSFKPWYNNNLLGGGANAQGGSNVIVSGTSTQGPPPVITLRLRIQKTLVQAFLTLAISYDGSSGDTYDKLIGGLGAGLPESYFSLGSVSATPLTILGNTIEMLQLDQLLNPVNEYYFDCSKGISLKDWLSNECIGAQLLLGSRKNGLIALRSWVHEVASSVTLSALNKQVVPADSERGGLSALRKLDLLYGTNVFDLEPLYHRSIRFQGEVKEGETQPLRIWRQGLQLFGGAINAIDIFGLLRAFYQVFGRKPKCYPVEIALEDFILQGIQFGDAVRWVDADVVTCNGLGFDADCFVVSIDCDYGAGKVTLLLIENTLFTSPTPTVAGNIAPSLKILSVSNVNATTVDVEVDRIDGIAFDPILDFGGLYDSIQGNAGYLWINNYYQAPIGDLEKVGDLEAYCILDSITPGTPNVFRLVVDSDWIRGANIAVVDDLFVVGETRLNLPPRVPAIANLENNLIEPDSVALPEDQNYVTFMPRRPLYGTTHTFGS